MKRLSLVALCLALLWIGAGLAWLTWPLRAVLAPRSPRTKNSLRLLDHLTGHCWFGSNWWESLSANSARVRREWLVRALDQVEPGHCAQALQRELDVIDFFNRREQQQ
jgi:hypothetical protein